MIRACFRRFVGLRTASFGLDFMRCIKLLCAAAFAASLFTGTLALAAEQKAEKKLTCCQKADAEGKECRNKCCVAAHRAGKSCEKCNPGKEDLAILEKNKKKAAK